MAGKIASRTKNHTPPAIDSRRSDCANIVARFYQPDLSQNIDSPFVRDGDNKLVRRCYWLDIDDRTLVMMMVNGIVENLTNDVKRAHLTDVHWEYLINQVVLRKYLRRNKVTSISAYKGAIRNRNEVGKLRLSGTDPFLLTTQIISSTTRPGSFSSVRSG